jgi:hypothetical protein
MKQIFFLVFVLLSVAEAKAQHSDLYSYIMNTVKPTHFPEENTITIKVTHTLEGWTRDNQPVLVINGVIQIVSQAHNITTFESLDAYTMAQLQSVYIWNRKGDMAQNVYAGMKGIRGIIFVYTKEYVFPDAQNPNVPRRLGADYNKATRIVVFEAPLPAPLKKKGDKK